MTKELIDTFPEINPVNYNDDDVNALNAWGIAAQGAIEALQARVAELEKANYVYRSTATDVIKMVEAARDALQAQLERHATLVYELQEERCALQARVAELGYDSKYFQETINEMCDAIPNYDWNGGAEKKIAAAFAERDALAERVAELEAETAHKAMVIATWRDKHDTLAAELAAIKSQEPVARVNTYDVNTLDWLDMSGTLGCGTSLFAAPTSPVREPLSVDRLNQLWTDAVNTGDPTAGKLHIRFARKVESAIKEKSC